MIHISFSAITSISKFTIQIFLSGGLPGFAQNTIPDPTAHKKSANPLRTRRFFPYTPPHAVGVVVKVC
jgi:hypothetical protein